MGNTHKVITGDSRNMSKIADKSVHLIITSPPYWQLKDYGTEQQIGFDHSYEEYINNLNLVWQECERVLHPGCRLCINIGDQFARSVYYGRYKVIPIRTEIIKFCESLGMDYMGAIIWQKKTTMNTSGGGVVMGSFPYPRNGILKIDYEFILLFKKLGQAPKPTKAQKEASEMSREEWNEYFSGHWNFAGAKQDKHIAMFPLELPHRLIKMFSFVGETVLDPFAGSGTTNLAAKLLNRNSIAYEINPKYVEVIRERFNPSQANLFESEVTYLTDDTPFDLDKKLANVPYVFSDPHKIDKKIDVKKLQFGSRLDDSEVKAPDYYAVKQIIDPVNMVLNNGLKIRLLGIKEKSHSNKQAMQYLQEKLRGQQVFLSFDATKYDEADTLLCYLYLRNKTFINMHLLKEGLVDFDNSIQFKYEKKFREVIDARMA
jgi:DNA modification methylase